MRLPTAAPLLPFSCRIVALLSFPPAIGHTTSLYVCGFAYGLKGFPVALVGSVFGSALVFVILRLLFSRRLRVWSSTNERWQALETVVVRTSSATSEYIVHSLTRMSGRMPRDFLSLYSSEHRHFLHGYTPTCYSQYVPSSTRPIIQHIYSRSVIVYRSCLPVAIHDCHNLHFPEILAIRLYWVSNGRII